MNFNQMSHALRVLSADMVHNANSGHLGSTFGLADVCTVLFSKYLIYKPSFPNWQARDRCVFSVGHAAPLVYSLLHLTGYQDLDVDQLKRFRTLNSDTPGHPERSTTGVEVTTGSLGQGIANSVGLAIAAIKSAKELSRTPQVICFAGDGCLMEGISYEATSLAGTLSLNNLTLVYDANKISIDGNIDKTFSENVPQRFRAIGWEVYEADAHNFDEIDKAFNYANNEKSKPVLLIFNSLIGKGSISEGSASLHAGPLSEEDRKSLKSQFDWKQEAFWVPNKIKQQWMNAGCSQSEQFSKMHDNSIHTTNVIDLSHIKQEIIRSNLQIATRAVTEKVISALHRTNSSLISGSADVSISTFLDSPTNKIINSKFKDGNFIHYGVREHGMVGIMNGIAAFGNIKAIGGTYMAFLDYAKPAIRMASMMKLDIILIATHDTISAGEDGPTHQPCEQLASYRESPNLLVLRPADAVEAIDCWEIALAQSETPVILSLSAQGHPATDDDIPHVYPSELENKCLYGAYAVFEPLKKRQLTILASGPEVGIALQAKDILVEKGFSVAVISMPCWELFDKQTDEYISETLGEAPRLAVEVGSTLAWHKYLGRNGHVLGLSEYGLSADWKTLYNHFGFTAENIANEAINLIS